MIKDITIQYVSIFDRALSELGQPPLSDNPNFVRDEISNDSYLQGILSVSGAVALTIIIDCQGIRVYPDRMNSVACFWSLGFKEDRKECIIQDIKAILTASVQVVYRGSSYTKSTFFDPDTGKELRVLTEQGLVSFFSWLFKKETVVYSPIVELASRPKRSDICI